jgi:hypothetical protein
MAGIPATPYATHRWKDYRQCVALMRYHLVPPQIINMRLRNTRGSFATLIGMTVAKRKRPGNPGLSARTPIRA